MGFRRHDLAALIMILTGTPVPKRDGATPMWADTRQSPAKLIYLRIKIDDICQSMRARSSARGWVRIDWQI